MGASSVSHSEIRMVAVTFIKLLYAGLYPPHVLSFNSQDETEAGGQGPGVGAGAGVRLTLGHLGSL